jgi:hypothetical protein
VHACLGDVVERDEVVVAGHAVDRLDASLVEASKEILRELNILT